ncbi:MAG TPA: toxin-antitoxin system YwqK family antitoxin [Saprospiraceae bacterium]|nr:toxin-antitoxin system YwqK family antitoxin [Saprospiraceae bacterium]HMQ83349.1 toxin-antitoxin system YwqK family antitoxin [Saprospiraceae bacterium]
MKSILLPFFLLFSLMFSCQSPSGNVEAAFDISAYQSEAVAGSEMTRLQKMDANGVLSEDGFIENGVPHGAWITYHQGGVFPAKITHYAQGKFNGAYFEFTQHGQLTVRANYKDNQFDGYWAKYSFGRPILEANYKNGQLDGVYKEYDTSTGTIQKEMNYKAGQLHGNYRFYNAEGSVIAEYEYENGEQVSGGIVNLPADTSATQ